MIARTDDGHFDVKKMVLVQPSRQPKKYHSVLSKLTIDLPDDPMPYTACPSVDRKDGIWAATGINEANVGMTATETITSNPRVLGADPLVCYEKPKRGEKAVPGGIGEEDLVVLVLPYIHTAREGVLRLGALLEQYGTYESNGIAFNDENEIWWLESIGGHHWMARKVPDDECVIMPNQFGMDQFDFDDAFGAQQAYLCSADLKEFIDQNHLDLNQGDVFNPRRCFGSHTDADHVYNNPRAWFMGRYLNPTAFVWDGPQPDFSPESDDIPWSFVPESKVTVEDVKYLLSSHYQGTPYDPYAHADRPQKGIYRSIGINRTGVMAICQIRGDQPDALKGLEWVCFGSTTFDTMIPVYTHVSKIPAYLSNVALEPSTENFYWSSRLLGALASPSFGPCLQHIERYQEAVQSKARHLVQEWDRKYQETKDLAELEKANEALCAMAKKETDKALGHVLLTASEQMKNGYNRSDN